MVSNTGNFWRKGDYLLFSFVLFRTFSVCIRILWNFLFFFIFNDALIRWNIEGSWLDSLRLSCLSGKCCIIDCFFADYSVWWLIFLILNFFKYGLRIIGFRFFCKDLWTGNLSREFYFVCGEEWGWLFNENNRFTLIDIIWIKLICITLHPFWLAKVNIFSIIILACQFEKRFCLWSSLLWSRWIENLLETFEGIIFFFSEEGNYDGEFSIVSVFESVYRLSSSFFDVLFSVRQSHSCDKASSKFILLLGSFYINLVIISLPSLLISCHAWWFLL